MVFCSWPSIGRTCFSPATSRCGARFNGSTASTTVRPKTRSLSWRNPGVRIGAWRSAICSRPNSRPERQQCAGSWPRWRSAVSCGPGFARRPKASAHRVSLLLEGPQRLVQQTPDRLAGAVSEPGEHGRVQGSEGDGSQDLRAHVLLCVQPEPRRECVDDRHAEVLSIDHLLLSERGSLTNQTDQ